MCLIKSKKVKTPKVPKQVQPDPVIRQQADASLTKTGADESFQGYERNIKTSVIGLTDEAPTQKKTLLGE